MTNKPININQVMLKMNEIPLVKSNAILKEAVEQMNDYNLGIVCIIDDDDKLVGVITDGDIRRKLLKVQKPFSALLIDDAIDHSIKNPIIINANDTLKNSVEIMGEKQIWDLPVVNEKGILVGLLHLHPAVKLLLKNS